MTQTPNEYPLQSSGAQLNPIADQEITEIVLVAPDEKTDPKTTDAQAFDHPKSTTHYDHLAAIAYMAFHMKVLSPLLINFMNGFLTSGIYNTALVLRLNQRYGLGSTSAGLVYFAVGIPAAAVSPISVGMHSYLRESCANPAGQGALTDRFGSRRLAIICCIGFIPSLCLLIIDQLPLPAFIVMLSFCGIFSGLINSVRLQKLIAHTVTNRQIHSLYWFSSHTYRKNRGAGSGHPTFTEVSTWLSA